MWVGRGLGGGGGSSAECCSSGAGDGLKVILIRFTTQTQRNDTAALGNTTSMQGIEDKTI